MHEHIDYPAYVPAAIQARDALQRVMREAKSLLPPAVTQQHFIAGHHSPTAWRSVEKWYSNQPEAQPDMMIVLMDLALMAEALSSLLSITTAREDKPRGSLKLAKQRHVEV